mmetsp:Transcript_16115/g.52446  ORF Transcript_16115/g.52446 Transcript_16115/m.52446 type:complete len:192 (+) Transcript_16115:103-678(+)
MRDAGRVLVIFYKNLLRALADRSIRTFVDVVRKKFRDDSCAARVKLGRSTAVPQETIRIYGERVPRFVFDRALRIAKTIAFAGTCVLPSTLTSESTGGLRLPLGVGSRQLRGQHGPRAEGNFRRVALAADGAARGGGRSVVLREERIRVLALWFCYEPAIQRKMRIMVHKVEKPELSLDTQEDDDDDVFNP